MALNKKIFDATIAGTEFVYIALNAINKTSFQITHPGSGTIVFRVSNSTQPVEVKNAAQMATIGWSDYPTWNQTTQNYVYVVDLSFPEYASPTTIVIECLNCQFMQIEVSGTGQYIIEQHINTMDSYVRED